MASHDYRARPSSAAVPLDRDAGPSCRSGGGPGQSKATVLRNQYESELRTSLRLRVPMAHQVWRAIEFLMNLTEPSAKQTLTPPEWLLVGATLHMRAAPVVWCPRLLV